MDQKLIAIVDYGMGNLRSVFQAAEHVANGSQKIIITQDPAVVSQADAIIFPGQGAAKACMQALQQTGMSQAVKQAAQEKPFLGICMGLQVLLTKSTENNGVACLDVIPGEVNRFNFEASSALKIPHMGWNQIHQQQAHPLWQNIPQDSRFYFVHSYYVTPKDPLTINATTTHGITYPSVLSQNNVFAIQAHPEKSAAHGLQLLKNFLHWNGQSF